MAKMTSANAIAAAQQAGRNAAHDWEPGSISNSDHRLRSLMNFERDVVKSTWDDTEALPQWNAFLQAYDAEANARGSEGANGMPAISSGELRKKLEAAALDVCDQHQIITLAEEKIDDDDPAAFALLRSIKGFNDQIFHKLEPLIEALPEQDKEASHAA